MVLFGTCYGTNRLEGVLHRPSEPAEQTGNLVLGATFRISRLPRQNEAESDTVRQLYCE
jgi:hypothetical protein